MGLFVCVAELEQRNVGGDPERFLNEQNQWICQPDTDSVAGKERQIVEVNAPSTHLGKRKT